MAFLEFVSNGSDNMGSRTNFASVMRSSMDADFFALRSAAINFTGGTTEATLEIWVDSRLGTQFDRLLHKQTGTGTGGQNLALRFEDFDQAQFAMARGDVMVIEWTNPDGGVMLWNARVVLETVDE